MRRSSSWDWLPLILILVLIGAASGLAAKAAYRLTLGYLGGIAAQYYASYNGSQYYSLANLQQLGAIAKLVMRGSNAAASAAFDAWLDVADPLGLIRDAMGRGEIVEDDTLFRSVPP